MWVLRPSSASAQLHVCRQCSVLAQRLAESLISEHWPPIHLRAPVFPKPLNRWVWLPHLYWRWHLHINGFQYYSVITIGVSKHLVFSFILVPLRVEFCGIPATPHEKDMNCARHILFPISSSPPPFSLLSPPHSIHSSSPSSLPSVLVLHSLFPLWIGIYTHACVPVCVSDQRSVNSLGHSSFLQPWGVLQK